MTNQSAGARATRLSHGLMIKETHRRNYVADRTRRPKSSFDAKCYELAEYFMAEPAGKWRDEDRTELAERIQRTIEDFLYEEGNDNG